MKNLFRLFAIYLFLSIFLLIENQGSNNRVNFKPSKFKQISIQNPLYEGKVHALDKFLTRINSPLAPYARLFVEEASNNSLDYRLVAAIAGVESNFGKAVPYNSYNAWGWANGKHYFNNWNQAIKIVSKTLNEKYAKKGAITPYQINRYYASSKTWHIRVSYFMDKIEESENKMLALKINI